MNLIRCKIALVGDPRVGKTNIVSQLVKNSFNNTYQTTLGIDYTQHEVKIKDTNYTVQFHILDFTGFSVFRELLNTQIKDVNFILYVYDSTNLESFTNIKLWKMAIQELLTKKNVGEYLVGNKSELPEKIVTDKTSVDAMAETLKMKAWNVSARTMLNIKEMFDDMANCYYKNYKNFIDKVKSVLQPFEEYQKARITFSQSIAELASRPQNIEALHSAGVMALLRPLLLDNVPSIQQSAALAIGRLANYSEELAESVVQNDIITQLIYSLAKPNRFFKKAACYVFKSVAKHSPQLAEDIVKCGVLEPLVQCLDEFDPSVKEAAAWALGYISKHNANLASQVVEARAVDSLILCLQEPEILLKRASALTLSYICQHTEQLAQPVAENGLDTITFFLSYNDTQLKRNICQLLGNITKHSPDLATQVMAKINNPQKLLNCLKDSDDIVKKNAAFCICEIVNKSPENAQAICSAGGPGILVDFITNIKGDPRLYGILSLGFIAAFKDDLAMNVIQAKAISQLRDALQNEPHQHIKAAACYALGHIGRHSAKHAKEVSDANVLSLMLYYFMDPNSTDDLKLKAKNALKKIIDSCSNLSALEPLLHVAPEKILKHILQQYVKNLKGNTQEMRNFAQNGGLQKIQELKAKVGPKIQALITDINSYYPADIVKYYSPDYAADLLNKIGGDVKA